MKPQPKLDARVRMKQILDAALALACKGRSYTSLSRDEIARAAGIPSSSLIQYHFGTMPDFQRDIMREAIRRECLPVIAQGLAVGDKRCKKLDPELKAKALQALTA